MAKLTKAELVAQLADYGVEVTATEHSKFELRALLQEAKGRAQDPLVAQSAPASAPRRPQQGSAPALSANPEPQPTSAATPSANPEQSESELVLAFLDDCATVSAVALGPSRVIARDRCVRVSAQTLKNLQQQKLAVITEDAWLAQEVGRIQTRELAAGKSQGEAQAAAERLAASHLAQLRARANAVVL